MVLEEEEGGSIVNLSSFCLRSRTWSANFSSRRARVRESSDLDVREFVAAAVTEGGEDWVLSFGLWEEAEGDEVEEVEGCSACCCGCRGGEEERGDEEDGLTMEVISIAEAVDASRMDTSGESSAIFVCACVF